MTYTSSPAHPIQHSHSRSLYADLAFWTAAGGVLAVLHGPLGSRWGASGEVLLDVGLALVVAGPILWLGLNRLPHRRGLIAGFAVANCVMAPLSFAAAWLDWLGLTRSGNGALGVAGLVMLVLGGWQLSALRRS